MRIALVGYGKMGKAIEKIAKSEGGEIVCCLWPSSPDVKNRLITKESIAGAQIAFEFTQPKTVVDNIRELARLGCNIVVGTTGWEKEFYQVQQIVEESGIGLLYGSNFSLGMLIFEKMAARAAKALGKMPEVGFALTERHHTGKIDAPSGTAKMIKNELQPNLAEELSITSVRVGKEPGQHELIIDFPFETVTLTHAVRDRKTFALGAWQAAKWLQGKKGIYSTKDMLEGIVQ